MLLQMKIIEILKEIVRVKFKDGEILTYKKYDAKDITIIKDVVKENAEEKEYQNELKELENLEKEDSKIKNN